MIELDDLPHAPNGDPQDETDECPECHRDPCECPPEGSAEAWRWPQDT